MHQCAPPFSTAATISPRRRFEPPSTLDADLRVKTANRSFYDSFQVSKEETENRLVYDLGDGQWDIPRFAEIAE
jgi:hypothetical protein